ncbi:hypothetical protein DCO56_08250 [Sphingobacterium athyrii]|uniref:Uncharacterized protein n=1 Tax=Sphingobacterium athyrii TaxID=2152717 RepID=A0A363NVU7_9SPHI|nr:hypothetical protein DCO56_08250 [Sphingobacterium athyrii]
MHDLVLCPLEQQIGTKDKLFLKVQTNPKIKKQQQTFADIELIFNYLHTRYVLFEHLIQIFYFFTKISSSCYVSI